MVLNERKGRRFLGWWQNFGFAGALLMDLFLLGKITNSTEEIEIINSRSTGNEILDQILKILETFKKKRGLWWWINKLSRKYKHYRYLNFDHMEQQGILRSETRPFLRSKRYYLQKPEIKSQLLEKIHSLINNNKEHNINIICLLTLLEVSSMLSKFLPSDQRKKARNRIKKILNSEQLDSLSREMILTIKKDIQYFVQGSFMMA